MNRALLRQLAEDRILDAGCLLAGGRWSAAYYLAGYAVECGLKACILAHIEASGAIFVDRKFSEKCWTHDFEELLGLADLRQTFGCRCCCERRPIGQLDFCQRLGRNQPLSTTDAGGCPNDVQCHR